jgi:endonuclease-8
VWQREQGDLPRLVGRPIIAVEAIGKHLLVGIGDAHVLHTHLGMPGRVRRIPPTAAPEWDTSAILATDAASFMWRSARTADVVRKDDPRFIKAMQRIGPDLLAPEHDVADTVQRARLASDPSRPLIDVLLDQSIAAGIGNVFKSEIMFACGLHPLRTIGTVDDAVLDRAYTLARAMLQRSVRDGFRDTVGVADPERGRAGGTRLWVYERAGGPCRVCSATIVRGDLGEDSRTTYHCPRCQPPAMLKQ